MPVEELDVIKWTRLSCRTFAANAVRLLLHALAYNLGNFMRTLAMPETAQPWSLTSLREKLIKIGAKVGSHGFGEVDGRQPIWDAALFRPVVPIAISGAADGCGAAIRVRGFPS